MTALAKIPPERGAGLWTADRFLEFYMSRPDEERWQLVDGLPAMMVPPSFVHQRIVGNLEELLRKRLAESGSEHFAYGNVGLRIPGVEDFHPQPDVVVCAADADYGYYADRFFLVAEVVSPSNTAEMIGRKLELYQRHPDNLYCVTIDQDSVHVTVDARDAEGWTRSELTSLDGFLHLPAFGLEATLADIYRGTPLVRAAGA
jgi:Uma2 family endonuclease